MIKLLWNHEPFWGVEIVKQSGSYQEKSVWKRLNCWNIWEKCPHSQDVWTGIQPTKMGSIGNPRSGQVRSSVPRILAHSVADVHCAAARTEGWGADVRCPMPCSLMDDVDWGYYPWVSWVMQQGTVVQKCQTSGWNACPPVLLVLPQQFTSVASFDGNNATSQWSIIGLRNWQKVSGFEQFVRKFLAKMSQHVATCPFWFGWCQQLGAI
jgi:hypothetical protein